MHSPSQVLRPGVCLWMRSAGGTFLTARAGVADVAVIGETIRILAFPGQAHAAVAARALSQSAFAAGLFTRAATSIDLQLKGQALDPQGTASSHAAIDARLSQGAGLPLP